MVNDAIFEGDGLGKPLGILSSGALIEAGRETASTILHTDILSYVEPLTAPQPGQCRLVRQLPGRSQAE